MSIFALSCLIASIILYFSYTIYTYIKYSPTCISETYYKIGNKFTIWIILTSCLILPAWLEISVVQFLPFLSVVFLSIVGLAPQYLSNDRVLHISSALATATISLIWNFIQGIYVIPIALVFVALILTILKVKNLTFWIENCAFLNIYLSILLS